MALGGAWRGREDSRPQQGRLGGAGPRLAGCHPATFGSPPTISGSAQGHLRAIPDQPRATVQPPTGHTRAIFGQPCRAGRPGPGRTVPGPGAARRPGPAAAAHRGSPRAGGSGAPGSGVRRPGSAIAVALRRAGVARHRGWGRPKPRPSPPAPPRPRARLRDTPPHLLVSFSAHPILLRSRFAVY